MFSKLFGSKMEKDLKTILQGGSELEMRYQGGETKIASRMLGVLRDSVVVLGFPGPLKKKELFVRLIHNGVGFNTTILRTGKDKAGNLTFHCKIPERLMPTKGFKRHMVQSNGNCKVMIGTRMGDESANLPIWDLSECGVSLVNKSKLDFKIGTKLFQSMISIGGGQAHLVDLQVAGVKAQTIGKEKVPTLVCIFPTEPRGMSELLSAAKAAAPKR